MAYSFDISQAPSGGLVIRREPGAVPRGLGLAFQWTGGLFLSAESPGFELNDLGRLTLRCHAPLFVDAYAASRSTGAFILIDALTNDTVAAGMIEPARADAAPVEEIDRVTAADRRARLGQGGAVIEIGGREALALAYRLERALFERGRVAAVVAAEHAAAFAGVALIAIVPRSDLPDGVTLDGAPVDGDPVLAVLQSAGRIDAARADHR